jgi:ubiquinone/menaquinone biosynthesis C-methylase UbiE
MDRAYYKQYYYLERNHWWFVVRSALIEKCLALHIDKQRPLKILNIGIATGATSVMLEKFGEVISSEYDKETCELVREELGMEVIEASVTQLPFEDESFDLVCAFDVIEHVQDDSKAIEEMKRTCKKGGFVAVTVPADMALWSRHDEINHHFRRYNLQEVKTLTRESGLNTVYASYFNTLLYPLILAARKLKNLFSKNQKPTSDFDLKVPDFVNSGLKLIFSAEKWWFGRKNMPFGVSLMWIGKKNDEPQG